MASVSWIYPQDELIALRRQNTLADAATPVEVGLDINNLRFRYSIEGDNPPWRPLRAFDDGRRVYIEFPRGIAQGEMPPLFIVGPEGEHIRTVNYRVRGGHVIVDRLFAPPGAAGWQPDSARVPIHAHGWSLQLVTSSQVTA